MPEGQQPPPGSKRVEVPEQKASEKALAPVAKISSKVDPMPQYIMSAASAGGAAYAYSRLSNPRAALIAGGFSLSYFFAGRLHTQGHHRLGYDVGSVTSLALTSVTGPTAWATGEAYATVMATLGGMSTVANLLKSYQARTGKPLEPYMTERRGGEKAVESH